MAAPRSKGRSFISDRTMISDLGDANLQRRGIGLGTGRHRSDAGRLNAQYVDVDLTNEPDLAVVNVSHRLGLKPTFCELVETRNTGAAAQAAARPVDKDKWTPTNCRVAVTMLVGTQSGTVLKFRVGGE